MYRLNNAFGRQWLIPLLSIAALLGFLFLVFPFNAGDTSQRNPLGPALWATWTASDDSAQDHSYCLLVPLIVGYIVYEKRKELANADISGISLAIIVVFLGLVLFWLGSKAGKQYLGCAGIQVLIAGIILWIWGWEVFRLLLFPWAFITFAWPLLFIDTAIAFPMRLMVSHLAYYTLNLIGVPCLQDGTALISLPDLQTGLHTGDRFKIDVADPCSGLHSLMALLMFSACFGYFFLPRVWQQWTVFISAFPLIIVGNVIRIILLVFGCIFFGSTFALGTGKDPSWYHEGCGFAVFAVLIGLELALGSLLLAIKPRRSKKRIKMALNVTGQPVLVPDKQQSPPPPAATGEAVPIWRSAVLFGVALMMVGVWLCSSPLQLSEQAGVLMSLPDELNAPSAQGGDFFGSPAAVSEVEHRMLPQDTEFCRKNYDDFAGHQILLSIVLSGLQQYTIHPPQVCLVAQGWKILKEEDLPIRLDSGNNLVVRNLSIQRDVMGTDNQRHHLDAYYMYWYVTDGISTPSHATRNWISTRERILHNRDHRWAYVIAMSEITKPFRVTGLDANQTREMLVNFIRRAVPTFQKSELADQVGGLGQK